ncbi:uncharacterized protein LOC131811687 [Mustela lutreola]|uniref:uncharacterized protein LOC131811687 n=1 Tax=Mustela lutreola TaxID=9666 RepID=UPI002797756E|nr:uncharacterized protein LOC131811687 [Mustela lutreola]
MGPRGWDWGRKQSAASQSATAGQGRQRGEGGDPPCVWGRCGAWEVGGAVRGHLSWKYPPPLPAAPSEVISHLPPPHTCLQGWSDVSPRSKFLPPPPMSPQMPQAGPLGTGVGFLQDAGGVELGRNSRKCREAAGERRMEVNPPRAGLQRTLGLGAGKHPAFAGMEERAPSPEGPSSKPEGAHKEEGGGAGVRWKLRTRPQPEEELGAGGRSALQGEACLGEQTVAVGGQRRRGGGKPAGAGRCLSLDPVPFPVSNIIVLSAAIMYIVLTFNLPPPKQRRHNCYPLAPIRCGYQGLEKLHGVLQAVPLPQSRRRSGSRCGLKQLPWSCQ